MNDLIRRQDAIDAIVTWTVEDRPDIEMPTDLVDRITDLPSADASLMQVRCKIDASSDLISRQDTIDEIKALYEWHDTVTEDRVVDHLKRLPSSQRHGCRCQNR